MSDDINFGIDFESFATLREDQIKEAIPDVIPRIMFENKFKKFQENISKTQQYGDIAGSDSICVIINPNQNTNSTSSYDSTSEPIFDKNFDSFNSVTGPVMVSKTVLSSQKTQRNALAINTVQDIIDIPSIELKIVITKYIEKKFVKENNDRTIIGKEIIHHLLVNDLERMITREEYIKLAKLIVQLFPKELEGTYYLPSVKGSPTQGKLYSAFTNYRAQLKSVGLIEKKDNLTVDGIDEDLQVERVKLKEKSDALKVALEENFDFDHVKTCWKACYNERRTLLNDFSTFEYIRRFPSFELPTGYELLILDGDTLLANKKSMLLEIAPKIIIYAIPKRKTILEVKNLMIAYEELIVGLDIESIEFQTIQQLIAIRLLPHLMPNPKKKLSKSEVERLFCPYLKTALEADAHNTSLNQNYKDNPIILKPRIYLVGDVSKPRATICIANKKYDIEDSLLGFDIFFKSFLALNCQYPEETNHIWQFIQKVVYGLERSKGKKIASVDAFINDIETMIV